MYPPLKESNGRNICLRFGLASIVVVWSVDGSSVLLRSMDFLRSHLIVNAPLSVDHFQSTLLSGCKCSI
jgi:hypothetical protein